MQKLQILKNQLVIVLLVLTTTSCSTYRWKGVIHRPENDIRPKNIIPESIEISQDITRLNHFWIKNRSSDVVYVSFSDSVAEFEGQSYRLVSGTTKKIHSAMQSPDQPIAPNTVAEVSFYSDDELITSKLVNPKELVKYRIAFKSSENKAYAIYYSQDLTEIIEFTTPIAKSDKIACYITGIVYGGWCWFISPNENDKNKALNEANKLGADNKIKYLGKSF
ncbi:MAG TPA: hypothetical protein PKC21_08420 [Oligoflexia bacterium]|nr:hypothetical protein [Oligoflexia bacterium]HMR25364.1 hypothetical protein [Oligoflexia bacterium]